MIELYLSIMMLAGFWLMTIPPTDLPNHPLYVSGGRLMYYIIYHCRIHPHVFKTEKDAWKAIDGFYDEFDTEYRVVADDDSEFQRLMARWPNKYKEGYFLL